MGAAGCVEKEVLVGVVVDRVVVFVPAFLTGGTNVGVPLAAVVSV